MDKYKIIKQMGVGTFGQVFKAVNTNSNEVVAIKRLQQGMTWEEATKMIEVKALQKLNNHPNVIKVFELVRKENTVHIVQEFCERNLLKEMNSRFEGNKPFSEHEIKCIMS